MEVSLAAILEIISVISYTAIISSLIWGRFYFFSKVSKSSSIISLINDPLVLTQIISTYYLLASSTQLAWKLACTVIGYFLSFYLFWWSVNMAKNLNFATEKSKHGIIVNGPFAYVRHPFYTSYILAWLSSTFLLGGIALSISFFCLSFLYYFTAKKEEAEILNSTQSSAYEEYRRAVGMFIPRLNIKSH